MNNENENESVRTLTKEEKKKAALKEVLGTSLYLLGIVVLSFLIVTFVGQRTEVIGSSMETTLSDQDNLILDKITYRFREPKRFEIVVFPFRNGEKKNYIKRIIGLPGETVRIDESGNIYINDELLKENYGREVIKNPGNALNGITLGEGEYFVLGDNRNNSSDSRRDEVGKVSKDEILGKVWIRIWPLNKFGSVAKKK